MNEPSVLEEDKLESIVSSLISSAENYIDEEEAPARISASNYYDGLPYGNEEEGRSQVVTYEVRDTISMMLPQIMRTFLGPEKVVEYVPRNMEDVETASQATDYVNQVVLSQDNDVYSLLGTVFHDALLKRAGVVRVDWEDIEEVEYEELSGLDDTAMNYLLTDNSVEITEVSTEAIETAAGVIQQHHVEIKHTKEAGRIRVAALPPEEFIISRSARSVDDTPIVGHRRYLTVSTLVEMGYDYEEMLEYADDGEEFENNLEYQTRTSGSQWGDTQDSGDANKKVLYVEAFANVDVDGDGVAELRKFCCVGTHHKIIEHYPVSQSPFVVFCPYPKPHIWHGQSVADITMDVQKIKSMVVRNTLDSLAKAVHPDTEVVEGQANMEDVLSNRVGKIVRTRAPGMVREMVKDFTGREAFQMVDYLDKVKEDRTGMSKASMGLNPDALQSSTKAAVSATVQASQAQIELVCRNFAERGMKPLFRKILRLLHQHQDQERMVRLRNTWVPVVPQSWDAGMDVACNVALGLGTAEDRMQMLAGLAGKQEAILEKMGPENPLVNLQQYHATLAKMTELSGFKDVGSYWTDPSTYQPPPPEPPQPTPDEIFAQAQADKVRADMEVDQARLSLDQEKMNKEDDLARDKLETEVELKSREIEARYQTQIDSARLKGLMDFDREALRQNTQTQEV